MTENKENVETKQLVEVSELIEFKEDCRSKSTDEVVQKYLVDGSSFFFDLYYGTDEEFQAKRSIAQSLGTHIRDIVIVGSGKLGFSIKPDRDIPGLYRFKNFDQDYDYDKDNKKSDLDIAIVSGRLFDDQLKNCTNTLTPKCPNSVQRRYR